MLIPFVHVSLSGSGTIWLDDVACTGEELRLEDCRNRGWGTNNCGHAEDVGIVCSNEPEGNALLYK